MDRTQITVGLGSIAAVGSIDMLAHLGPTGLVIGGIVAYAAYKLTPDIMGQVPAEKLPALPQLTTPSSLRLQGNRSFADRLLGRFPEEEEVLDTSLLMEEGEDNLLDTANMIDLAPDLQIDENDVVGKAIFVCGIRRHGKTTLGARIAEQLGRRYIPLFIPCLEGDYLSLADVLPRAVIAGHSSADSVYRGYEFRTLDDSTSAYQLGYAILETGYQVILDMASYANLDQAIAMQINIIRGMFHWANTHPDQRVPSHVFLDEAQRYLPQALSDSVILDKVILGELLRAYMDIIAIGGKRGIAPIILTQRFAQVNKKIMAQSEVFFLMRQTNDGDLDRCMEYVNSETATKEQISRFKPGQGIYIASDGTQTVTHFHQRESSGKRSSTPQAYAARRYASMPMQQPASRSIPKEEPQAVMAEPTQLERAMKAYDEGHTSIDRLAAALGITSWQARPIMAQVKLEKGVK